VKILYKRTLFNSFFPSEILYYRLVMYLPIVILNYAHIVIERSEGHTVIIITFLRESRYVTRKPGGANFTFNLAFAKRKPRAQYYNIGIK